MTFRKKATISLIIILSLFISAFSCETSTKSKETINPIKSIVLSKNSVNLTAGKRTVITARVSYATDTEEVEKYSWSSDDTSIATITKDGIITAIANVSVP